MKTLITVLTWMAWAATCSAQFTYLNQITGEQGDEESNASTNVEVVENGYVVWGGGVDSGSLFQFARKYNFEGEVVLENILIDQNEYVLSGLTNSFKWNPTIQKFVYIHGTNLNNGTTEGYMIEFDENLDTVFTRRFDQYPPYTYPFIFALDPDGYIVAGEYGGLPNTNGTFLMKLDIDGNLLWSEIMNPEIMGGGVYRNWYITHLSNGGYMAAGEVKSGGDRFARITLTDSLGSTLSIIDYADPDALRTYAAHAAKLDNGEIVVGLMIGYEDVASHSNPDVIWTNLRLYKFDPETETFYNQVNYLDNYDFWVGRINDIEATPDGGAVVLGERPGISYDDYAWIMKVDSNLNQQWYKEYAYEECPDCSNLPYDIELAPDGGYVVAGYFTNISIDPRNSTWLLKIDACGDVEWQGCEPVVGVEDAVDAGRRSVVYPNPASSKIFVESPIQRTMVSHAFFGPAGKRVAAGPSSGPSIDVSDLARGLYLLQLTFNDGGVESHKVVLIK